MTSASNLGSRVCKSSNESLSSGIPLFSANFTAAPIGIKQAKMFRVGQRTNLVLIEMDCGRNNLKNNNKYKNENEE